ncbi:MAG: M48 family metallopeptidase [Clostridia bacterium]|nr:M48 family metallopeptidase [Clostridia bacterium]
MDYKIVFSGRKTISLCVKDGKLVVKAPYGTDKKRISDLVISHADWIKKHVDKQVEKNKRFASLTDKDIDMLRQSAKKLLPLKVEYYADIMGLKYGRITITGAKTRFGSCSSKGNLAFSYRLMLYPEAAIDYVVVHELAHIRELNHSPAFYKIVASVLPDYKERVKMLKK